MSAQRNRDKALRKSLRGITSVKGVRNMSLAANPLLTSRTPVWRSKLLVAALALGFVVLTARAAYVQGVGSAFFLKQGEVRYARTFETPANRGRILDRNGLILASSVPAQSIWMAPEEIDAKAQSVKWTQMGALLGMSAKELDARLAVRGKSVVYIKRQVDEALARQIMALEIKGVYLRKEYRRQYTEGEAMAHIVGFTNVEDRGQEGIECAFDAALAGRSGSRRVIRDGLGRVLQGVGEQIPPTDGDDIHLSIDSKIQYFAWQKLREAVLAHKAKGGSVVVLEVDSGEVLALANYPGYDPNDRKTLFGERLRNRALTDIYEPGSTLKPMGVALALQQGKVSPQTPIDTSPGEYSIGGFTIKDPVNYGTLSVSAVLQKSSNIGALRIGQRLSARDMWDNFSRLGLGQKPELPFPGVASGRLRPYKNWQEADKVTMSYGYGLSASLFQLARAYSVFAHDGVLMPVRLLRQAPERWRDGASAQLEAPPAGAQEKCYRQSLLWMNAAASAPTQGEQIYKPEVARQIRHMLHLVTQPGGTAQQARTVGYSVGGKTGTARKQEGKSYTDKKYRASFVGIAPIEAPRIIVAVMIDEPQAGGFHGGAVAAPVFAEVVQQTLRILGVQPDMSVQPGVITDAAEEAL